MRLSWIIFWLSALVAPMKTRLLIRLQVHVTANLFLVSKDAFCTHYSVRILESVT